MYRDAFRAQCYAHLIEESMNELAANAGLNSEFFQRTISHISDLADQIVLPAVAYEIALARTGGLLIGRNGKERYRSFFVRNQQWTFLCKNLQCKYPLMFEMIKTLVRTSVENITECVSRFRADRDALHQAFALKAVPEIADVSLLSSDRHCGGRHALLVTCADGAKLVYKPISLEPELVFRSYLDLLELREGFDIRLPRVVDCGGYGWVEFVAHASCEEEQQVRTYYQRAGALIAVVDSLNYCDGHMDNLIAYGEYPVLIDCESIFQTFGNLGSSGVERSILFTGLVEKAPEEGSGRGFTSALQTPCYGRFDFLSPHAINEGTDELEVRMQGFSPDRSTNMPMLKDNYVTPHDYVEQILAGFDYVYDRISERAGAVLGNEHWWRKAAECKTRQLIRHTLYYQYLIRRVQQPECIADKDMAESALRDLLVRGDARSNDLVSYEISDLVRLDIPYFWHYPGSRHLYDAYNRRHENYFETTALGDVEKALKQRGVAYKDRSLEILRNVIPQSPYPYQTVFRV